MKSEDEEEELAAADRQDDEEVEDEEVDEAELEAFLDGQLADMPFLQQEGSRQGIALENQEHNTFSIPSSKAEDALRTCKFHHKRSVHLKLYRTFLTYLYLFCSSGDAEAGSFQPHDEQRGRGGERGDRGE